MFGYYKNIIQKTMFVMGVIFSITIAPAFAQQVSIDNTETSETNRLIVIQELYNMLQNIDYKDVYEEIDIIRADSQNLSGEEKFDKLLLALEYSYWLDESIRLNEIIADMRNIEMPEDRIEESKIILDLYGAYAKVVDGKYAEGVAGIEKGIEDANNLGDDIIIALAYEKLGASEAFFGKYYTAIENLQIAQYRLSQSDGILADRMRVGVYLTLAFVYVSLDDAERAVEYYISSLEYTTKHGLAVDAGTIIYNVGFLLLEKEYLGEAEQFFKTLIPYYEKVGDPSNLTYPYYGLAYVSYYRKNYEQSKIWAEKSYGYATAVVDFYGTLAQLLAENEAWLGNVDKAREYLAEANEYYETYPEFQNTIWEARSLRVRAVIAYAEGRYIDAIEEYENFHLAYSEATNIAFSNDMQTLTKNLEESLVSERAESDLLRKNMALESENLANQRYLNGLIAFLLLVLIGVIIFQMRWGKILTQSKLEAENASRSKSDFLAQMSHELRTPLNAIIGFSEMMSKGILGELNNKKYKDYVVLINQSGLHLLRIINDILDISKVESGKLELVESNFDMCILIKETVDTMSSRAERENITISNHTTEQCDETVKCSNIYADRRIIKQVLFNILSNAIKFTPSGGNVDIRYEINADGEIIVYIKDSGQGMSDEDLKQAMEPFGQVKSVLVQSHEGTGLGLPLAKAFMEMHGGNMVIVSNPGEGTAVSLILPKNRVI